MVGVGDVGRGDASDGGDLCDTVRTDGTAQESVAEDVYVGDGVAVGEDVEARRGHPKLVIHHDELPCLTNNYRLGLEERLYEVA